ncbi:MAG: family 1 glycosylhydrolase [Bacillota bacterium]
MLRKWVADAGAWENPTTVDASARSCEQTDNFEWRDAYTQKFGLYSLSPEDPELTRAPRPSARLYARIAQANGLTDNVLSQIPGALSQAQVASRAPQ